MKDRINPVPTMVLHMRSYFRWSLRCNMSAMPNEKGRAETK